MNCRRDSVEAFFELTFDTEGLLSLGATRFGQEACDFAVGWEKQQMFRLPVSGQSLEEALPVRGVFRECTAAF